MDIRYTNAHNSLVMDKNSRDPVHCWLVLGKAFQAAAKYLYAGLEETGIDDTDFRILEALFSKGPLPVNTIGPKVYLTPGSISTAVDRLVERDLVSRVESARDRRVRVVSLTPEGKELIAPIFRKIAAQVDGEPCCRYMGPDGAGHYVKMVHNGIEYGDMQLICEAYAILKDVIGMDSKQLAETFTEWNKGDLDSYLVEITAEVLRQVDAKTGKPLVDVILDEAEQKGTGRWTVKSALDLGVPVTGIAEAVFARALSGSVAQRHATTGLASGDLGEKPSDTDKFIEDVRQALYASKIVAYAQGFNQIQAGSAEYDWGITPGDLATIWRGGCIIRAKFLNRIKEAFDEDPDLPTLISASYFRSAVENAIDSWRRVVATATQLGIPIPGFASALSYYDALRTERLPAALIQGLRDFFGAHTYARIDADREQKFHTLWSGDRSEVPA